MCPCYGGNGVAASESAPNGSLPPGRQFLFLTDDSGVGAAHGEPHISFYKVERLERLMVRVIAGELSGKRVEPDPAAVLRTVGKPIN